VLGRKERERESGRYPNMRGGLHIGGKRKDGRGWKNSIRLINRRFVEKKNTRVSRAGVREKKKHCVLEIDMGEQVWKKA